MSENKRFLLERSDYDLKYEFRIADLSRVDKTKEDFWDEEEEMYNYRGIDGFLDYLYDNNAFLTQEEADQVLNELHEENERLRNQLSHIQYRFFEYKNKRKIITEKEVKKTLQKYFNRYTQMALELRHDKYGNGVCHDVTEILMEIADDLGVKLE